MSFTEAENFFHSMIDTLENSNLNSKRKRQKLHNSLGTTLFKDGDYEVILEAHFAYEKLYLSFWFEPDDFKQRKCLRKLEF